MNRKKDKSAAKKTQITKERHQKIARILAASGCQEEIQKDWVLNKLFFRIYSPGMRIELGESCEPNRETDKFLADSKEEYARETYDCPLLGKKTPIKDLFSFVKPVTNNLILAKSVSYKMPPSVMLAAQKLESLNLDQLVADVYNMFVRRLEFKLLQTIRLDQTMYWIRGRFGLDKYKKLEGQVFLESESPQMRTFTVDGISRPAFRCGRPLSPRGFGWSSIPQSAIFGHSSNLQLPVFVQNHALKNLIQRLRFSIGSDWYWQDCLWGSLHKPVVTRLRDDGKFLIEYRAKDYKLGYLVAHAVGDALLIETFLFLTMDGTPEGNLLSRKISLTRDDKNHLRLDQMHTFMLTDIRDDPQLVKIFKSCGCGHLFEMSKEIFSEPYRVGEADELNKYLGLEATS